MAQPVARAKVRFNGWKEEQFAPDGKQRVLEFSTIHDPKVPESRRFQKSNPRGDVHMHVDNPAVLAVFGHEAIGKYFFVDFIPVD